MTDSDDELALGPGKQDGPRVDVEVGLEAEAACLRQDHDVVSHPDLPDKVLCKDCTEIFFVAVREELDPVEVLAAFRRGEWQS